ncbi:MAG: gliding motility-associated C-terminal domain-containing protein [Bacteroidia bacterium]
MKRLLLTLCGGLGVLLAFGQHHPALPNYACGADHLRHHIHHHQPGVLQFQQLLDRNWQQHANHGGGTSEQVYSLPTVVHIIQENPQGGLTDSDVIQAITAMNQALGNQAPFGPSSGADTEVEFCLAKRDPFGNPTEGITRTISSLANMTMETQDSLLKALAFWNSAEYVNIWVVESINSIAVGANITGYATFPSLHGSAIDGIVGERRFFYPKKDRISVFVHEAGHYLGLYHTFEGGCVNNDCTADGDQICDTPPDGSSTTVPCSQIVNSCTTDSDDTQARNPFRSVSLGGSGDQPDLKENFMDYSKLACYESFTEGQKNRIRFGISGVRSSLLNSNGCSDPCSQNLAASINAMGLPASVGSTLQLDAAISATYSSVKWSVNNQSFSTSPQSSFTFNQKGRYEFTLEVVGTDSLCHASDVLVLDIECQLQAAISGFQSNMLPGQTLTLSAQPANMLGYTWLVNGQNAGSGQFFTFRNNFSGNYAIQLVVDDGACKDTTENHLLRVGNCGVASYRHKMVWALEDSLLLDFKPASSRALAQGKLFGVNPNVPFQSRLESSVSLTDEFGDLLFYTNGNTVWDKQHNPMPDGQGLLGSVSTQHGVVAFQDPGSAHQYYIFTQDAYENQFSRGVRYSLIDMHLNNGLGDVVPGVKNIMLTVSNGEHMAAVVHANGKDVWLVIRKNMASSFPPASTDPSYLESYKVSAQGVQSSPSISTLQSTGSVVGSFKFSHDGTLLVDAGAAKNGAGPFSFFKHPVMLYTFDRQAGRVQPLMQLMDGQQLFVPYGAEFSADNSKLYISDLETTIYQFDLSSGVNTTIRNSRTTITANLDPGVCGKMELGPDRKIYISPNEARFLHRIDWPDRAGQACDLQLEAVALPLGDMQGKSLNLPSYVRGMPDAAFQLLAPNLYPCPGEIVKVFPEAALAQGEITYRLDTFSLLADTFTFAASKPGIVTIMAQYVSPCGVFNDTIEIEVKRGPVVDLGADQLFCNRPTLLRIPSESHVQYSWQDGVSSASRNVYKPGTFTLFAIDTVTGCTSTDSIEILPFTPKPAPDLGEDQTVCPGAVSVLEVASIHDDIRWYNGSNNRKITVAKPGVFWVKVRDVCGFVQTDTVRFEEEIPPDLELPDTVIVCFEESHTIDARKTGLVYYRWENGLEEGVRTFEEAGFYVLEAKSGIGCKVSDSLEVTINPPTPPIMIPERDTVCAGDTLLVDAETTGLFAYQWNDGWRAPARVLDESGIYEVEGYDAVGCSSKAAIDFYVNAPPGIDMPTELYACGATSISLDATVDGLSGFVWDDGTEGPKRTVAKTRRYNVVAYDALHCASRGYADVYMEYCPTQIHIASAFTPNKDGINEHFGPFTGMHVKNFSIAIYNRWGKEVFRGRGVDAFWDGNFKGHTCPEGVYVYVLSFTNEDGRSASREGTVTLLR